MPVLRGSAVFWKNRRIKFMRETKCVEGPTLGIKWKMNVMGDFFLFVRLCLSLFILRRASNKSRPLPLNVSTRLASERRMCARAETVQTAV